MTDPLPLAQALIRCRSVTPADGGAQDVLAQALDQKGFTVHRLPFGTTPNLFARRGTGAPHFCFAGHTDVVPPGDAPWTAGPFDATVRDGLLLGHGACDMKGAIAAFVAALDGPCPPSVSLLVTGDEEGPATDGTVRVLEWMEHNGHIPDLCLVGEPTNPRHLGEVIKIGRRGSLNVNMVVHGTQGHVAYPHQADNPVHRLVRILAALTAAPLDAGSEWFEPSSLQLTSIDVANPATNVIPARAEARFNIRFNDLHTSARLRAWIAATAASYTDPGADQVDIIATCSGESFLTQPGPMIDRLRTAIATACGIEPQFNTGGGTSDARFIARLCPVAEFGLVGATMHKADEAVPVAELRALAATYRAVLAEFA